jgi:hypothetical protein
MKVTVTYKGFDFELYGDYEPYIPAKLTADPYDSHPAEGGYFEIDKVLLDGIDVYDLLNDETLEVLEVLAYKEVSGGQS